MSRAFPFFARIWTHYSFIIGNGVFIAWNATECSVDMFTLRVNRGSEKMQHAKGNNNNSNNRQMNKKLQTENFCRLRTFFLSFSISWLASGTSLSIAHAKVCIVPGKCNSIAAATASATPATAAARQFTKRKKHVALSGRRTKNSVSE